MKHVRSFAALTALLAACTMVANAETKRTSTIYGGGTGPYKAIVCEESTLTSHTIYRPKDMKAAVAKEGKLPVLLWGNGACSNSNWGNRDMLNEIASRGYICIAIGPYQAADSDPTPGGTDMYPALDWVMKQPTTANSEYKDYIDTKKIGAAGHSCGGAQAMSTTKDSRVSTIIMCNSGMGAGTSMGGASPDNLKSIHGPILYLLGGPDDVAYGNGLYDYDHITVNQPVCLFNKAIGHGGSFWGPNGGDYGQIIPDWLDWVFKGKRENIKIFRDNIKPSAYSSWEMKSKNMPSYTEEIVSEAMKALNHMQGSFTLPTAASSKETVEWSFEEMVPGYVELSARSLTVNKQPEGDKPLTVGRLVCNVTYNGKTTTVSNWVTLAPVDESYGVLFSYVNTSTKNLGFAYARHAAKSLSYSLIGSGDDFPASSINLEEIAPTNKGLGEAHVYRDVDSDGFVLTCNDATSTAEVSHAFALLKSRDLKTWETKTIDLWNGRSAFLDSTRSAAYTSDERYKQIVKTSAPRVGKLAPKDQNEYPYFMTSILRSTYKSEKNPRIFYSHVDSSFSAMTQPRVLYDPVEEVIDAVLEFSPYDSLYHMLYIVKNGNDPAILYHATSKRLLRGTWDDTKHVLSQIEDPRGIVLYRAQNKSLYNLYTFDSKGIVTHWQTDILFSTVTKLKSYTRPRGLPGEVVFISMDEHAAFSNWATAIDNVEAGIADEAALYSPLGQRVGKKYKGLVIKNGQKQVQK